jgi:hypothetical protein
MPRLTKQFFITHFFDENVKNTKFSFWKEQFQNFSKQISINSYLFNSNFIKRFTKLFY